MIKKIEQKENIRNKIKILVKVSIKNDLVTISKISSTVSQYGIEDTTLLDLKLTEMLQAFLFSDKKISFISEEFFLPVYIILFRDETETEVFFLMPSQQKLLNCFFDKKVSFNSYMLFLIGGLSKYENFIEFKNYNFYYNFLKNLKGVLNAFKNRDFLKKRKINFRRKVKKESYDSF